MKRQKKGGKIKPRNFLVPILRMKKAKRFLDEKKEMSKRLCRNWEKDDEIM